MTVTVDRSRIIWEEVEGETLVIDTGTGFYYSLDEVGGVVWEMLADGRPTDHVVSRICREFDVDVATARRDVEELVAELLREELLLAGPPER